MTVKLFACASIVILVATLVCAQSVWELYSLPSGSEIRPMNMGMQTLVFGLGTPLCIAGVIVFALQSNGTQGRTVGHRCRTWATVILFAAASLLPLGLLIFGGRWVAATHNLVFLP